MTTIWVLVLAAGPPFLFWLLILATSVIGLLEYGKMTLPAQGAPTLAVCAAIGVLPVVGALLPGAEYVQACTFISLLGVILLSFILYARLDNGLRFLSLLSFGILYISFCLAQLVMIRSQPQGVGWLLVLTAVTAGGDTGAYYIGRAIGRTKLSPHISPGKTVEGAVGGILAAVACATATGLIVLPASSPLLVSLTALLLAPVTIAGDLAESIIKRSTGNKDSGSLLSGHGGVLDRIDSMLLAGPLLYYLLYTGVLA
jgi:phosphatidate cytidylyltransferase